MTSQANPLLKKRTPWFVLRCIRVFNSLGVLIMDKRGEAHFINLSAYQNGIYYIQIIDNAGQYYSIPYLKEN